MTFKAASLPARIEGQAGPFPLKALDGSSLEAISREDLDDLIAMGTVVTGVGSNTKLRYFKLTVENEELENMRVGRARDIRENRARPPLEFLIRMATARKSTFRDNFSVIRDGKPHRASIFLHKANVWLFKPKIRAARA